MFNNGPQKGVMATIFWGRNILVVGRDMAFSICRVLTVVEFSMKKMRLLVKGNISKTDWFKTALNKLNTVLTEDMSDYDPSQDYDTRVKLPEWQLAALKKRQAKRDQQSLK